MTESFPRRQARTRRFSLGAPRGFTISADGSRVLFLRSRGGTDPVTCLWSLDTATGAERLVADPLALGQVGDAEPPPEERARRERSREQAGGIIGYNCDSASDGAPTVAAFTLAGVLHLAELGADGAPPRAVSTPPGVIDARPDPLGNRVAYVSGGALWLYDRSTGTSTALAEPESDTVRYGLADFVAAEEMERMRGYWWAPDGSALLVARTDDAPVTRWHIADPANPDRRPTEVAYPAAGTPNALTELYVLGQDGSRTRVAWNPDGEEYLVDADWSATPDGTELLITVQPRDQRALRVLRVDPYTGTTEPVCERTDPHWVDIVPGVPTRLSGGELVWLADSEDARRLLVGGVAVTPPTLRVRSVLGIDGDTVLFGAAEDPCEVRLWTYRAGAGDDGALDDGLSCLTPSVGVFGGRRRNGTMVITAQTLDTDGTRVEVHRADGGVLAIESLAEPSGLVPNVALLTTSTGPRKPGPSTRGPSTAVLPPTAHRPGEKLPVLMDPYGGPHAQRVRAASAAFLTSQWFADQGFAVVVADGRGTPGRGPAYERAVAGDLAAPVLDDQVTALRQAAAEYPDLDLRPFGIRGWSFGGYLAALAVLRRPDVFHAAVAGAPVTDWALYDTHYTERYLGDPATQPEVYRRSSLIIDAPKLTRPLLLIHGLADDNVVAAHTLRLSSALLAAGRPHSVLPLSGVTHMTPQEEVAENLLLLQVEFLHHALAAPAH